MKKYVNIYKIGVILLTVALVINLLASFVGLMNWYNYIATPSEASLLDYLWLFLGYPFCLGLAVLLIFNPGKNK